MRHIKEFAQLFESQQELTQEQKDWLDKCTDGNWSVNLQTGLVDVDGSFDCPKQGLRDFKGVRFGKVGLSFDCGTNWLTSLKGAPQSVGGSFFCSENVLTSLEEAPQSVEGTFSCSYNPLVSLKGAPQSVGGSFYCDNNNLTSLEGAPRSVGGSFFCSYNSLTSLKGAPQSVGNNFYCSDNSLTSLEGAPLSVGGNFYCPFNTISAETLNGVIVMMSDKKITLEQAVSDLWNQIPEEDRTYLAKHHPDLSPAEKREYAALERMKTRVI